MLILYKHEDVTIETTHSFCGDTYYIQYSVSLLNIKILKILFQIFDQNTRSPFLRAKLSNRILSDPKNSNRILSEVVGILGIGIRQEVVGCRNDQIPIGTVVIPTLSYWNPIPRIPTTSDEFLSDPIKPDSFSGRSRWDSTVGSIDLGRDKTVSYQWVKIIVVFIIPFNPIFLETWKTKMI